MLHIARTLPLVQDDNNCNNIKTKSNIEETINFFKCILIQKNINQLIMQGLYTYHLEQFIACVDNLIVSLNPINNVNNTPIQSISNTSVTVGSSYFGPELIIIDQLSGNKETLKIPNKRRSSELLKTFKTQLKNYEKFGMMSFFSEDIEQSFINYHNIFNETKLQKENSHVILFLSNKNGINGIISEECQLSYNSFDSKGRTTGDVLVHHLTIQDANNILKKPNNDFISLINSTDDTQFKIESGIKSCLKYITGKQSQEESQKEINIKLYGNGDNAYIVAAAYSYLQYFFGNTLENQFIIKKFKILFPEFDSIQSKIIDMKINYFLYLANPEKIKFRNGYTLNDGIPKPIGTGQTFIIISGNLNDNKINSNHIYVADPTVNLIVINQAPDYLSKIFHNTLNTHTTYKFFDINTKNIITTKITQQINNNISLSPTTNKARRQENISNPYNSILYIENFFLEDDIVIKSLVKDFLLMVFSAEIIDVNTIVIILNLDADAYQYALTNTGFQEYAPKTFAEINKKYGKKTVTDSDQYIINSFYLTQKSNVLQQLKEKATKFADVQEIESICLSKIELLITESWMKLAINSFLTTKFRQTIEFINNYAKWDDFYKKLDGNGISRQLIERIKNPVISVVLTHTQINELENVLNLLQVQHDLKDENDLIKEFKFRMKRGFKII